MRIKIMTTTNRNTSFLNVNDALAILNLQPNNITFEDIKTAYHKAATKYHPDHNPAGLEMMKMVNIAYEVLKAQDISKISQTATSQDYDYGDAINTALNSVIGLTGLTIEVCGVWVWIGGNTKEYRENLKKAGFLWAPKKSLWYFRPKTHKSHNRHSWDMERIRSIYGQTNINPKEQRPLQMYN
jgi:hypothetical protein